jgi:hypothetical protein
MGISEKDSSSIVGMDFGFGSSTNCGIQPSGTGLASGSARQIR